MGLSILQHLQGRGKLWFAAMKEDSVDLPLTITKGSLNALIEGRDIE
jgi:hypothetical protein